ncbi:MAG: CRTAC1 family protein [Balneolales bacterium]
MAEITKKDRLVKLGVTLAFVGLLAIPWTLKQISQWQDESASQMTKEQALERHGFYLEEISLTAGIDFRHQPPELDARLDHILPQVASLGASVSVTDFNNDGFQDLYVTNSAAGSQNALYQNLGDGTFRDVAGELGVADLNRPATGASMGTIWGDVNNDGYEDLFLYKWGKPELFLNNKGQGFTRVTAASGLPEWINANTAVWLDYDSNGYLDLFIGGFYPGHIDLWNLESTKIMPDSYEYAQNGGRNFLFRNMGNGTFEDVTDAVGLTSTRWTLAAAAADLNNSGFPDLMIANDYGIDEFYINVDGKRFRNASGETGIGFVPKSGMGVSFGDIFNQGRLSVYITNIAEPGYLIQGNNLWVPSARSERTELRFKNLAGNVGVELGDWGYGSQFLDLNNDGNLDLYLANGYVSAGEGTDYWYDFAKVASGNVSIIEDARNWPAMNGRSFSGFQDNKIWLNDGSGRFREVSAMVGGRLNLDSRAVAYADLWNRGVCDLIVASQNGPLKVYKNTTVTENQWIGFDLEAGASNRSAIGAMVEVFWNGRSQLQTVGGGNGFSSQNQRALHFGLGPEANMEKVEIRWPSGKHQVLFEPELNKRHAIYESDMYE